MQRWPRCEGARIKALDDYWTTRLISRAMRITGYKTRQGISVQEIVAGFGEPHTPNSVEKRRQIIWKLNDQWNL